MSLFPGLTLMSPATPQFTYLRYLIFHGILVEIFPLHFKMGACELKMPLFQMLLKQEFGASGALRVLSPNRLSAASLPSRPFAPLGTPVLAQDVRDADIQSCCQQEHFRVCAIKQWTLLRPLKSGSPTCFTANTIQHSTYREQCRDQIRANKKVNKVK